MGNAEDEIELQQLEQLASSRRQLDVVERCSHLLEQFPDEGRLYFRRGHARNRLRDKAAAIEDMTRAREKMPAEPAAHFSAAFGVWRLEHMLMA
jgi:regulator of sirC expression with transglutaminase-like and TPR domain